MKISSAATMLTVIMLSIALPLTIAAFPIPERLEFDVSYTGISAGRVVQEVFEDNGEVHIISTARSAAWLKFFFPVEDRIESILVPGPSGSIGVPRLYRERIREGWTRFQKDALFDQEKMEVVTKDFLNNTESTQKITAQTYDTLSSFYYFRSVAMQVGKSNFIEVFDCKKLWSTEVQVVRHEEIEIPLGRFKTLLIKPIMKYNGIFARTGDVFIWLTDDERHIPVQMKSKVGIGSITATLAGGSYWPQGK